MAKSNQFESLTGTDSIVFLVFPRWKYHFLDKQCHANKKSQIFIGDWNHENAMAALLNSPERDKKKHTEKTNSKNSEPSKSESRTY